MFRRRERSLALQIGEEHVSKASVMAAGTSEYNPLCARGSGQDPVVLSGGTGPAVGVCQLWIDKVPDHTAKPTWIPPSEWRTDWKGVVTTGSTPCKNNSSQPYKATYKLVYDNQFKTNNDYDQCSTPLCAHP